MKNGNWGTAFCRPILTLILLVPCLLMNIPWAVAEDADRGEDIFTGALALSKGGAPCIACHALTGFGSASAANYGPDLSNLYADYGDGGVMAVLESLDFSAMQAVYANRPLTEAERLDLTAFLARRAGEKDPSTPSLALPILLGVIVVFAIVALLGKRRLKGVRRPLIEQARRKLGEQTQRGDVQ